MNKGAIIENYKDEQQCKCKASKNIPTDNGSFCTIDT